MLFLGVKECKVLLYILWEVIGNVEISLLMSKSGPSGGYSGNTFLT